MSDGARRWRPLGERECYLRLYGHRSRQVELVNEAPVRSARASGGALHEGPALHLVFLVRRPPLRMTGEAIRLDLLRRMGARVEADQPRAA